MSDNLAVKIFKKINDPKLKNAWIKLQQESSVFPQMFYEWIEPWVKLRMGARKLHIVTVSKNNTIVAIAPFCIEKKFGIRVLTAIPIHYGDKYDFIVSKSIDNKEAYSHIFNEISNSKKYSAIKIAQLEEETELFKYLRSLNDYNGKKLINCPTTDFYGLTYDEFIKTLHRNVRSDFRRGKRRISEIGNLQFEVDKTIDYYLGNEKTFRELYEKRWGEIDKNLPDDNYYNCRRQSFTKTLEKGKALIVTLKVDDKIVGYRLGFVNNKTYHDWKLCFDVEYSKYEISSIMTSELIAYLIVNGYHMINYGPGDYYYKKKWSPQKTYKENYIFLKAMNNPIASIYLKYELEYKEKIKDLLVKLKIKRN